MQFEALDGHGHVAGVEPHRHVELEVGGDRDAHSRGRREGDDAGRHIDRPAGELVHSVLVDLDRAGDPFGDRADLDDAARRIALDQLMLGQGIIACPQQLPGGLTVGPVLEPEAVDLAPSRPKERDQLVDLRLLLEAACDIPAAARLGPVDVALLVAACGRHHRGRELRPACCARRCCPETGSRGTRSSTSPVSVEPQPTHTALARRPALA